VFVGRWAGVLYDSDVGAPAEVKAWRPAVPGIMEVFHAHFTDHAYPMHVHDSWTLLIVDDGAVRYDLDRHEHGALDSMVTLLPPSVPHNGSATTPHGFRKRVLYLAPDQLGARQALIGAAVDAPAVVDATLRHWISQTHQAVARPGDELAAEGHLALVVERLRRHLDREFSYGVTASPGTARQLRDLLHARTVSGISLDEAAGLLHVHPTHLVRAFGREFGMSPHQYLMSRRVDLARRRLLDGEPISTVATETGFYDQPHLTRSFKRIVGTSPGRFARAG
jgi:AraC-like DNA-binding protein